MKLALRWFCLTSLLCASWAVVGADDKQAKKTGSQTVLEALPRPNPKLNGAKTTPLPALPSASVPAGSAVAVLSPPTTSVDSPPPVVLPSAARPTEARAAASSSGVIQLSHGTLTPTPEMWFYEQARQDYHDLDLQARRRGEAYAAERRARLAARAWYGLSNSRPTANVTPFMYHYSPAWASNTISPYFWSGRGASTVVVEARRTVGLSGFGAW